MATISAEQTIGEKGNFKYLWTPITEADTAATKLVNGGKYTVTVRGTFGGGSIEIKYSDTSGSEATIDATNLVFSAAGSYNIEIGRGYVLPVRTGGSSMSVSVSVIPIV
jgi:hypothetical protein